ncbi:phosphatase PAP2 family protein [Actinopolymorpha singaporensis]
MGDAASKDGGMWRNAKSALSGMLRDFHGVDRAVYQAVADIPSAHLDGPVRRLSNAANHSFLWMGIAGAMAVLGGSRERVAAVEGTLAIAVTSAIVNLGVKPLAGRARPMRGPNASASRHVQMPASRSFPSGHAASAFAFAHAVGRHTPVLGVPIHLLAAAVAYSRVHTGVHYPGDVVIGAVVGSSTAAAVGAVCDRLCGLTSHARHG